MADFGKLLLRLSLGILMGLHGYAKVTEFEKTNTFLAGLLRANGLPEEMVYGVYVTELLAPLLIVLGVWTRLASFTFAAGMGMAVYLAHMPELTDPSKMLTQHGGFSLELHALYFFGALALMFIGPGRIALQGEGADRDADDLRDSDARR